MKKISDEQQSYYCKYVDDCWKQHEDAMRPTHNLWKELWQLYQNKENTSKKAGWQSKCFVPKIMMQVEKAAGEIKRAILQTRKLFSFELDESKEREQIQDLLEQRAATEDPNEMAAIQQQINQVNEQLKIRTSRMQMREKQFKNMLSQSDFANVYAEMMKSCCLLGLGIPKVIWSEEGLRFEHLDAINFAISPEHQMYQSRRPPYMIERQEIPLAEFKARVKENPKVWDKKQALKIEEDARKVDYFADMQRRRGYGFYTERIKKVELKYFWGDVIDKDDEKIEENMLLVVANGKYLVRRQENPFTHGRPPFIPTIPMVYPHRSTHGISLIGPQVRLQYVINNIVNMFMDNLNFSITKMFEYNPNDLLNPNALTSMYPGKMIPVNTPAGQQAIREIQTSAIKRDILYFYELIDREMQEGSAVNEFISGMPGKKSKTLGEVELKTAESRGMFDTISRDIEMNSLRPLLEMCYDLCEQFLGWEPRKGNYVFTVSGITVMLQQKEVSEQTAMILAMVLQSPDLAQRTDVDGLWEKLLAAHNLSSVYRDTQSAAMQLAPQQKQAIQQRAEQDARQAVSQMPPEQIMKMAPEPQGSVAPQGRMAG